MDALPEDNKPDLAYETDYVIEDKAFFEPLEIKKPIGIDGYAWWNGPTGRSKVEELIRSFKIDLTVYEACISAGISPRQYKYFCEIHPNFVPTKRRLKGVLGIVAKQGMAQDLANKDGYRSRQWYLERRQPQIYGRDIGAYTPPPADAATKLTAEAFLDSDGKVIASKQMAEMIKKEYGDDAITPEGE